jgi:pimeloyl-ACP methyl ester carboxylesterase/DNA-binding CsgD family transcriptional regulator
MVTRPMGGGRPRYAPFVEPRVQFTTSLDGTSIAWTSIGTGPTLIHLPPVPFSNVEGDWRVPVLRRAFAALGDQLRFVQYDGRGTGRSQRDVTDLSLDAYLADLDAVVEASARGDPVVLLGYYAAAPHAIAWAARHPDRVRGVVLFGGATSHWQTMQGPAMGALLSLIERDWDTFVESVTHAWLGWPEGEEARLAAEGFRTSTTPAVARATLESIAGIDVTADAASVRCPVLVLHRAEAQVIPLEVSTELARALPGGRLAVIPGSSAGLFFETADLVVDRIVAFVRDPLAEPAAVAAAGGGRMRSRPEAGGLSPREVEVLRLLAAGESNGQIAAVLGLSINTVERHVSNAYRKIDARGRAEATAWAIRNGVA